MRERKLRSAAESLVRRFRESFMTYTQSIYKIKRKVKGKNTMRICSPSVPRLKHEWNHTVGLIINLRCGTAEGERAICTALAWIGNSGQLLNEECLSQLVAADERFRGSKAGEQVLDLAVLINLLRRADHRGRDHLQCIRISHSITLKALRLFAVEHRQNHSAGPQQFRQVRYHLLHECRLKVVQQVPQQHSVKGCARILQVPRQEARRTATRRHVQRFASTGVLAQARLFLGQKRLPSSEDVFRRNAETALDKEIQSCLPGRP